MAFQFQNFRSKLGQFLSSTVTLPKQHPYYPQNALIPNYVPNSTSQSILLATTFTLFSSIIGGSWFALSKYKTNLSTSEKLIASWFILCGILHCGFEGYLVWNFDTLASDQTIVGQLWKEYALSDSRYLTGDSLVYALETLTVFVWGPLSFLAAKDTIDQNPRKAITQTAVGVGHLFGLTLYYMLAFVDLAKGQSHSRPEPLYFWGYFVIFNAPWGIIPAILLYLNLTDIKPKVETVTSGKKKR